MNLCVLCALRGYFSLPQRHKEHKDSTKKTPIYAGVECNMKVVIFFALQERNVPFLENVPKYISIEEAEAVESFDQFVQVVVRSDRPMESQTP